MTDLATRFHAAIALLRQALGALATGYPSRLPVFTLLLGRLGRSASRFATLFALWQANALPRPRKPRPGRPAYPRAETPAIPRRRAWLLDMPDYTRRQVVAVRAEVERLLADPRMPDFLAAAPQAGRLLRPLCHMLGITAAPEIPVTLRLPPPPRFRPSPPPPSPYLGIIDPPEIRPFATVRPLGFFAGG